MFERFLSWFNSCSGGNVKVQSGNHIRANGVAVMNHKSTLARLFVYTQEKKSPHKMLDPD